MVKLLHHSWVVSDDDANPCHRRSEPRRSRGCPLMTASSMEMAMAVASICIVCKWIPLRKGESAGMVGVL